MKTHYTDFCPICGNALKLYRDTYHNSYYCPCIEYIEPHPSENIKEECQKILEHVLLLVPFK